jgi:hypothetical protein
MDHYSAVSFFNVGLLLVFMCSITFSTGTEFYSEEKFKDLVYKLNTKVYQLEEKTIRLEGKNIELEKKVVQLEAKNSQLEIKVQQQESILISLLVQTNQSESAIGSKSISNNHQTVIQSTGINGIPRTCRELRAADPSLPSEMYWIDPDGQGVGDNPIYVYCDMLSGIKMRL